MLLIREGTEAGRTACSPAGRRHKIKLPVHTFTTRTLPQLGSSPPDFQECLVLICSMPGRSARSSRRQHGTKLPWRVSPSYKEHPTESTSGPGYFLLQGEDGDKSRVPWAGQQRFRVTIPPQPEIQPCCTLRGRKEELGREQLMVTQHWPQLPRCQAVINNTKAAES